MSFASKVHSPVNSTFDPESDGTSLQILHRKALGIFMPLISTLFETRSSERGSPSPFPSALAPGPKSAFNTQFNLSPAEVKFVVAEAPLKFHTGGNSPCSLRCFPEKKTTHSNRSSPKNTGALATTNFTS